MISTQKTAITHSGAQRVQTSLPMNCSCCREITHHSRGMLAADGGAIITGYGQSSASGSTEMFTAEEQCLSDLTALISEHYVPKDDYDKLGRLMDQLAEADEKQTSGLLRQRDELREALKQIMFSSGTLKTVQDIAEAAIKNTETK